jgi:TolA-binding protein
MLADSTISSHYFETRFSRDVIDLSHSDSDGDIPNVPLVVSPEMRTGELEDTLNAVQMRIDELEDTLNAVQQERDETRRRLDDALINIARRDEIAR